MSLYESPQLGLFSEAKLPVPPAEREALIKLERALDPVFRFGTSSWTFEGWEGLVYVEHYQNKKDFLKRSLAEYARHPLLRTVGIDRTYYAPLDEETLSDYASLLPEGFRCVTKVWSEITTRVFPAHHARAGQINHRFLDPDLMDAFLTPFRREFAQHAGPFVIEVPPARGAVNTRGFNERLLRLFDSLSDSEFAFAVELRDERLLTEGYLRVLERFGVAHVFNYWTHMPSLENQFRIAGPSFGKAGVARLMLPPKTNYEDMKARFQPFNKIVVRQHAMRRDVLTLMDAVLDQAFETGVPLYIIANNKAEGSSPQTVLELVEQWVEQRGEGSF